MELFNFHFANLKNKQLSYNQFTNTYDCSSGIKNHNFYPSFKVFIENLVKNENKKQLIIIETYFVNNDNTENDVNSTVLFNNIVSKYGGILFSCNKINNNDNNAKINSQNIRYINMDSVIFLDSLTVNLKHNDTYKNVFLNIYLNTYNKNKSSIENANHYINEYKAIKPYLSNGSQIIINTFNDDNFTSLIKKEFPNNNLIFDKNQLIYLF